MAIYVRNEKTKELEPLEIPAIKGKDGVTPNISIGTVTTLEAGEQATVENVGTLENPILNFGIPKGKDGEGSGNASIDDTAISTETTWSSSKIEDFVLTNDDTIWTEVSGENLSIDYTKEGHLREVEIWGNTIQNEEDLSDIQHLGELYVNEDGEPILDELGREQYKIEIESCNKNLLNLNNFLNFRITASNNVDMINSGNVKTFVIPCKPSTSYTLTKYSSTDRNTIASHSKLLTQDDITASTTFDTIHNGGSGGNATDKPPTFSTGVNAKYIYISLTVSGQSCENIILVEGTIRPAYVPQKSNKTTLLLPCQLMKVGEVYDRLYWDSSKGKYVVEKNVTELIYVKNKWVCQNIETAPSNWLGVYETNIVNNKNCLEVALNLRPANVIDSKFISITSNVYFKEIASITNQFRCYIETDLLNTIDKNGVVEYLNNNDLIFLCGTTTPQLIETNILEEIKIPTYIDKTHLFINGGIDGSIKAKAPLDGGQAILCLSEENEVLRLGNEELKATNEVQDELINISLLATDEMYMMIEPLLTQTLSTRSTDRMINLYVAMVQRELKKREEVPIIYREQVKEILAQLEQ